MEKNRVSTAQMVCFTESELEEVKVVRADTSDQGSVLTLNRDYMKPVREYMESREAGRNGIIFMCPGLNKTQAAFLSAQAYMVIENADAQAEDSFEEMDSLEDDTELEDFFRDIGADDEDENIPADAKRDLLVIEYGAMFEQADNPNGDMVNMQKQQILRELTGKYDNALLVCSGNVDVDHFLYVYRTIPVQNKAICFWGKMDDFLLKRVTFELRTKPNQFVKLQNPTKQEYLEMLQQYLEKNGYPADKNAEALLQMLMDYRKDLFTEQDIYDHVGKRIRQKNADSGKLDLSDFAFTYSGKKEKPAIEQLEELIGLDAVKEQVKRAVVSQVLSDRSGFPVYGHMIFAGRPGTAKTTCARLYNNILAEQNISNGCFIEAGRADLIGSFLGETAPKIRKLFERADGGMIFIDEAGFLRKGYGREDMYVREAVTELVRNLENNPQTRVVFATYPEYAKEVLESDPGFSSRLKVLQFPSYSEEELLQILFKMTEDRRAVIEDSQKEAVGEAVLDYLRPMMDHSTFGNGREVRKILETALEEYGLEFFFGKKGKQPGRNKRIVLTAEHFKKAIAHIQSSRDALEDKQEKQRPIGFALPVVKEGMRV